jgi:hypothetical protein
VTISPISEGIWPLSRFPKNDLKNWTKLETNFNNNFDVSKKKNSVQFKYVVN